MANASTKRKHAWMFAVRDPIRTLRCRRYFAFTVGQASWYPGGVGGNSTTCVPSGEEWKAHRLDHDCGGSPASNRVNSSCGRCCTRVLAVLFTKVHIWNCYQVRRTYPCENVDRLQSVCSRIRCCRTQTRCLREALRCRRVGESSSVHKGPQMSRTLLKRARTHIYVYITRGAVPG